MAKVEKRKKKGYERVKVRSPYPFVTEYEKEFKTNFLKDMTMAAKEYLKKLDGFNS